MSGPTFKSCYVDWKQCHKLLTDALENEEVPEDKFQMVSTCLEAADAEITKLEQERLQASTKKYETLTQEIKDAKGQLEEVKKEAQAIIAAADKAEQLASILARLLPLIAA